MIRRRYRTRSQTRRMTEERDARIEWLEKEREQMAEMMELIRTLVKDKGSASVPNPQNETAQDRKSVV